MHTAPGLKVLYFGTPVVLISSRNQDGTTNLAPMSSAWWLNQSCMLGLGNSGQTTANLLRERECVLNLPSSSMVDAVDRLALTTGKSVVPDYKAKQGAAYSLQKFHDEFIKLGPLPLPLVRKAMLGDAGTLF